MTDIDTTAIRAARGAGFHWEAVLDLCDVLDAARAERDRLAACSYGGVSHICPAVMAAEAAEAELARIRRALTGGTL